MAIPDKNISQTTIPVGSTEYIVSYLCPENKNKEFPIAMMGVSRLLKDYVVCRDRSYNWHVLMLIRQGELIFRNDAEKNPKFCKFKQETLLFLPAHSFYTYGANDELQIIWFHLNPEAATWHFLKNSNIFNVPADDEENFHSLIMLLYREYTLTMKPNSNICYYTEKLIEHMLERKLKLFITETESMRKIRKLFEKIELSLDQNWTVEKMAKQCNISQSLLYSLSQQYFGQSPMSRIHYLRMAAAANLLSNSDLKLDAIASMVWLGCGFSLSRAFKRFYGVSPKVYKNQ